LPTPLNVIGTKENIFIGYCTKVLIFHSSCEEALTMYSPETSYAYDIEIIKKLYERKKITKEIFVLCKASSQKTIYQQDSFPSQ